MKNKPALSRMRNPPYGLGTQRENQMPKQKMAFFRLFWVIKEPASSFRNHFSQKTVYLNMAFSRRFGVIKEPRHSENPFSQETKMAYYLFIFPTILGC